MKVWFFFGSSGHFFENFIIFFGEINIFSKVWFFISRVLAFFRRFYYFFGEINIFFEGLNFYFGVLPFIGGFMFFLSEFFSFFSEKIIHFRGLYFLPSLSMTLWGHSRALKNNYILNLNNLSTIGPILDFKMSLVRAHLYIQHYLLR